MNINWFNWSAPCLFGVRLWNLFNRRSTDGHFWGFGVLQWRKRHLFFIGHCGVSLLFTLEIAKVGRKWAIVTSGAGRLIKRLNPK